MHRGSSKGTADAPTGPETLPLSAFPPFEVRFEVVRGGRSELRSVRLEAGTLLRAALRSIGEFGEGCAVFDGDASLPLDTRLDGPRTLRVVPTFSGG